MRVEEKRTRRRESAKEDAKVRGSFDRLRAFLRAFAFAFVLTPHTFAGPTTGPTTRDVETDVVAARQTVIREMQSTPEYQAAVKAMQAAFTAYNDKRAADVTAVVKTDQYVTSKTQIAQADTDLTAARQNPATTAEQYDELYTRRARWVRSLQAVEDDAVKRAGHEPLRTAWVEASSKLTAMQEKQSIDAEQDARVKAAVTARDQSRKVSGAPSNDEFIRRYSPADADVNGLFNK